MYQGYRDYDVTRKAERFVIIAPEQVNQKVNVPPPARTDVVFNWVEELKQRVPAP